MDEHAESLDRARAPVACGGEQRRSARVVDDVGDDLSVDAAAQASHGSSAVPMPIDVALTTMSQSGITSAMTDGTDGGQPGLPRPRRARPSG